MRIKLKLAILVFIIIAVVWGFAPLGSAASFDPSHQLYDQVVKRFVKDGLVDYPALKADSKDLDLYLDQLASVSEADFKKWSREEQLVYLINLYNAQTLHLIIDHYPVKSIKDIGNVLKGPWDQPVVRLFGNVTTLNTVEHKIIRKNYGEPRTHFVLVCAALGCPPLREEAYDPKRLEQQLEDQGRKFLATQRKNSIDLKDNVVYLSPIFKWFEVDFTKKSGSALAFVEHYFPSHPADLLKGRYQIKYTNYDWSLNVKR